MPTSKDQRTIDREAELARQKEVTDALAENEAAQLKLAQAILAGETSVEELEERRLADVRKPLNASVEAAAKGAKK